MEQQPATNYRQKEGAFFKHIMFLKTPLSDGRTVLDGYTHALPADLELWKKKGMSDYATQARYLLKRLLVEKPKAFAAGGKDRHGRAKKAYDIARFEVWVVNRNIGNDAHICTLVPSSLGGFVPDADLGGFIVGGDELAIYREWVLEIFYPKHAKKEAWCLAKADKTRRRARFVAGYMLPTTFEEFFEQNQRFVDNVYRLYEENGGHGGNVKRALVAEAEKQLHETWQSYDSRSEALTQELTLTIIVNLLFNAYVQESPMPA